MYSKGFFYSFNELRINNKTIQRPFSQQSRGAPGNPNYKNSNYKKSAQWLRSPLLTDCWSNPSARNSKESAQKPSRSDAQNQRWKPTYTQRAHTFAVRVVDVQMKSNGTAPSRMAHNLRSGAGGGREKGEIYTRPTQGENRP